MSQYLLHQANAFQGGKLSWNEDEDAHRERRERNGYRPGTLPAIPKLYQ